MPCDLKTPRTLEPILPAMCEKNVFCFLILFISQLKTTLDFFITVNRMITYHYIMQNPSTNNAV